MPSSLNRRIISGIVHVIKSGCRWRDCCLVSQRSVLKDFRRVAPRYDKPALDFVSVVVLAAIIAFWITNSFHLQQHGEGTALLLSGHLHVEQVGAFVVSADNISINGIASERDHAHGWRHWKQAAHDSSIRTDDEGGRCLLTRG
jgi:hypothetical protein